MSIWPNIYKTLQVFKKGSRIRTGKGSNTSFWHDKWLGGMALAKQFPNVFELLRAKEARVSDLVSFIGNTVSWNLHVRPRLPIHMQNEKRDLLALLEMVRLNYNQEDSIIWKESPNNLFSVKSAYNIFEDSSPLSFPYKHLEYKLSP